MSNQGWTQRSEMFTQIVEDLTPRLQKKTTNCRKPLPPGLKLAITLRYMATGSGCPPTPSSVLCHKCVKCVKVIYDHYHETSFKCPTTENGWKKVAQGLSDKWNFHHCCGCIDGKHMRLQAPPHSGSVYYNYKLLRYSIIMLALVDASYKFMYVDVGAHGADSDAGIFRKCGLEKDNTHLPPSEPLPGGDTDVPYYMVRTHLPSEAG